MTFSRQSVAHLDRRRAIAEQIVACHTHHERETAWKAYIAGLGKSARHYVKIGPSLPEQLAELLEPGKLERLVEANDG